MDALFVRPGRSCTYINTDPDEWWDKATQMAWMRETIKNADLVDGGVRVGDSTIRVEPGDYTVHVQGEVAWAREQPSSSTSRGASVSPAPPGVRPRRGRVAVRSIASVVRGAESGHLQNLTPVCQAHRDGSGLIAGPGFPGLPVLS